MANDRETFPTPKNWRRKPRRSFRDSTPGQFMFYRHSQISSGSAGGRRTAGENSTTAALRAPTINSMAQGRAPLCPKPWTECAKFFDLERLGQVADNKVSKRRKTVQRSAVNLA